MTKPHQLPKLPYPLDALEPHISKETLSYHYGKHHAAYVDKLNIAISGTEFADKPLDDIIRTATDSAILNNAAQAWNHNFYWHCLSPNQDSKPGKLLLHAIDAAFGNLENFTQQFTETAISLFGSGWAWLVVNQNGGLEIMPSENADNPMRYGYRPLLTCDVWEHAYYLDYKNARPAYLQAFWKLLNWEYVNEQYASEEFAEAVKSMDVSVDTDISSQQRTQRESQLNTWNEARAYKIADEEGIELTAAHLQVVQSLRDYYREHGIAENGRDLGNMLDKKFTSQGGRKYLRQLFPNGPVTQGMKIAGLPVPALSENSSFGTAR